MGEMGDFATESKNWKDGRHFEQEREVRELKEFEDGEKIWYNIANG